MAVEVLRSGMRYDDGDGAIIRAVQPLLSAAARNRSRGLAAAVVASIGVLTRDTLGHSARSVELLRAAQDPATADTLLAWGPHGPRYARTMITAALADPASRLDPVALARVYVALADVPGTPDQETASAAAIRRHYLGPDHKPSPGRPRSRRRR